MRLQPSEIIIGKRARQNVDIGIRELSQSIKELGQLQPVVIDDSKNLIAGARRVRACELLQIDVDCWVADGVDDAIKRLKAERDENTCRVNFTASEAVELGKSLEALERPKAEERKAATQSKPGEKAGSQGGGKLPPPSGENLGKPFICQLCGDPSYGAGHLCSKGKTRDKVAAAVGMSGRTYEKAKAVVQSADKPDAAPAVIEAKAEMDRTGKVDPAYQTVKRWEQGASQLPSLSNHSDADSESDNLFTLKQTWKKASKKDRKSFLSWVKENA